MRLPNAVSRTSGRGAREERVPVEVARRMALVGQGFGAERPAGRVDVRHVRRAIARVGVLQLDSVNVVCRSHYLPVFARVGAYPRTVLDQMAWGGGDRGERELFEFWAHAASLLPVRMYPLLRWRMAAAARWRWEGWADRRAPTRPPRTWSKTWDRAIQAPWAVVEGMTRLAEERPGLLDQVRRVVKERGPVAAAEANPDGERRGGPASEGGRMWNWQDAKIALEWLFCTGEVTTATRRHFERIYDLTERVLPAEVLAAPAPSREDAQRDLVRIAARAHGIATERQLRDYFHLPGADAQARVGELVECGELRPVRVDGVTQKMYASAEVEAEVPDKVRARALLSPFDSLIWDRDRTRRLFGFHYRISLYTPAAERTHGYYVMPFLLGERLVARVDVKAERRKSALLVQAAHAEPGVGKSEVAGELAEELRLLAAWLELDRVEVEGRRDLGAALRRATALTGSAAPRRRPR